MRRYIPILIFAASLLYAVYVHAAAAILPEDDAFITYRYVQNAFQGNGLVYNAGERVFGSSTPLYTLWLLLLRFLLPAADLPTLAVRTNLIWYCAAPIALGLLLYRLTNHRTLALAAGAIAASNGQLLDISLSGMESFLFAALLLGTLAAMAYDRVHLSAALVGLAAVTRPEGLLVGAVWGIWWVARHRKQFSAAFIAVLPLVCWVVFATLYYGTPIPHSVVAKNAPLYLISTRDAALSVLVLVAQWMAPSALLTRIPAPVTVVIVLVLVSMWWVLLRWKHTANRSLWLSVVAVFALMVLVYSTRGMRLFSWYLPAFWLLWLAITAGALYNLAAKAFATLPNVLPAAAGGVALVAVVLSVTANALPAVSLPNLTAYRVRVLAYQRCAQNLQAAVGSGSSVMASEIGALGYYYAGYVHDAAGLVSPEAVQFLPIPLEERFSPLTGAIRLAYVQAALPDYVVAMPAYIEKTLKPSGWFSAHYALQDTVSLPLSMNEGGWIEVWARQE
ncbi:MAG: hypothetical protein ACYC4R_02940 [Anaerolineae bacterium]